MNQNTRRQLAVELARTGKRQWQLAHLLGVSPTSLSGWVTGAHPGPEDLAERIEAALGLSPGALTAASKMTQ